MESNIYEIDDGTVRDPVMRCVNCKTIVSREYLNQKGCCSACRNRKFSLVVYFNDAEYEQWKDKLDPDFLKLFTEEG